MVGRLPGWQDESVKVCQRCGAPRPKGRTRYCSDECSGAASNDRETLRRGTRLQACQRCQGPKDPGIRGGKYCATCRELIADSSTSYEYERQRRRGVARAEARIVDGERVARRVHGGPDGHKWCPRCQLFRPLPLFGPRGDGAAAAYCKPCQKAYNAERRLKIKFGLTWDEYDAILQAQGGGCAICQGRPRKHMLSVDHDHGTGEVRGLLCSRCNHRLLGSANDDPARLRRAADYLESFLPRSVLGGPHMIPGATDD